MNLINRISSYLNALPILLEWTVSGRVVDEDEAQDRADICTGRKTGNPCPKNKEDFQLAEDIAAFFKQHVELKNKMQLRVQGEKQLYTCAGCGCPLKTKVWLEWRYVKPDAEEKNKFDQRCWLLKPNPTEQ